MGVVPLVVALEQFCRRNFENLLLALQRILSPAEKSQIFGCMQSCTSRDYFKFGCGYLLSIVGCMFVRQSRAKKIVTKIHQTMISKYPHPNLK